jgi:hypothetical protein
LLRDLQAGMQITFRLKARSAYDLTTPWLQWQLSGKAEMPLFFLSKRTQ